MKKLFYSVLLGGLAIMLSNCSSSGSSSSTTSSSTATESAAAAVGGSLNSSTSGGTVSMMEGPAEKNNIWQTLLGAKAYASTACPTITSNTGGTNCATNGAGINLTYSSCSFGSSSATWSGILAVTPSTSSFSCGGTLPTYANNTISRQFVNASNVASTVTRTSSAGLLVTISNASNLSDYASDTSHFITQFNSGYGSQVSHDGTGKVTNVAVTERIKATLLDHTVTGSLSVSESTVSGVKTWTISSGTMYVYHNLLQITGTSTFSNVVYNTTCCTPISGTISTSFSGGSSESLSFSSCGNASLTATAAGGSSVTSTVSVASCY